MKKNQTGIFPGRRKSCKPPKFFAVMIGVNDYKDAALNLNYPIKDVQDFGEIVRGQYQRNIQLSKLR